MLYPSGGIISSNHPADDGGSSDEDDDDDDYCYPEGNPLERKRFFVFENDRTYDIDYNMVQEYQAIRDKADAYTKETMKRLQIKGHFDITFSDNEEAEVNSLYLNAIWTQHNAPSIGTRL